MRVLPTVLLLLCLAAAAARGDADHLVLLEAENKQLRAEAEFSKRRMALL